jgi:hypothetical protein
VKFFVRGYQNMLTTIIESPRESQEVRFSSEIQINVVSLWQKTEWRVSFCDWASTATAKTGRKCRELIFTITHRLPRGSVRQLSELRALGLLGVSLGEAGVPRSRPARL